MSNIKNSLENDKEFRRVVTQKVRSMLIADALVVDKQCTWTYLQIIWRTVPIYANQSE